jgi:hypothetical protein
VEWPRFHLVSKGWFLVSSIRPLVSQFLPGGGKHETRHTAGSTFPPSIHVRIAPRPPRNLHPAHQARPIHQANRFTLDLQLQKSPTLGPWSPLTGFSVTPNPQTGSLSIDIPATNTPPYFFRVLAK